MPNRLQHESSAYLRQHQDQPVDWYPWGDEALARARDEDRPILLSIGYAACHWCHVMSRESFADPAIADLMNEHFVCIKVDREERPDLDGIYQQAVALMGQPGGWPLTVFLTSSLAPFFGGTYFPPREGLGRPSWRRVLLTLAEAYRERRQTITASAAELTSALSALVEQELGREPVAATLPDLVERSALRLARGIDPRHGGFGNAPKFPSPMALELLLRGARRLGKANDDDGRQELLGAVTLTLTKMAEGGIYDQLGGGFARYATDDEWRVPHFEKMTTDNALLLKLYTEAYQFTGDPLFARVARETGAFMLRELQAPEGGFLASLDADSEGLEGRYYVWTADEVAAVVGAETAEEATRYLGVTAAGSWAAPPGHGPAGASVLYLRERPADDAASARLEALRGALLQARERRERPGCDDQIVASTNGLAIGALAQAGWVLGEPELVAAARRAAALVLDAMREPSTGRVYRTYRGGTAKIPGTLDDHAFVAAGLIALHEVTGEGRWLEEARELTALALELFHEPASHTFFLTAREDPDLIVRPVSATDGPLPAGMSVAVGNLLRLGEILDEERFTASARAVLAAHTDAATRSPFAYASFLGAVDLLQDGLTTIVLVGDNPEPLAHAVSGVYLPNRVVLHAAGAPTALKHLRLAATPPGPGPTALVCQGFACRAPEGDPQRLREVLAGS